jgi:glycosyltransferase involved in cell wall biosynthesis
MKIAQVLLRYDAPGGVETFVREVSSKLKARGHEVRVFSSDLYDEGNWIHHEQPSTMVDGITVERFPVIRQLLPGITMPILPGLTEALVRWQPDVIHSHSHRYGHLLQSSLAAGVGSTPLVVSTHYHPATKDESLWKRTMLRGQDHMFGMTVYSRADAVIVETKREQDEVSEFVDKKKIHIVPPGLSWDIWGKVPSHNGAAARLGLPKDYILFAGRLAPNKGLPHLIEAWAGLSPRTRLPLVLVGQDWGMRSTIETRATELGVGEEIRFMGNLKDIKDYVSVFAGATVFVLPSEYEAFGLVLLEAMAASIPIVATRVGGIPEAVTEGETALLVPYGNVWELRKAMHEFVSDRELAQRFGKAGFERVERSFSWDRTVDSLVAIYNQIL